MGYSRRRFRDGRLGSLRRIDRCFLQTLTVDILAIPASAIRLSDVTAPSMASWVCRVERVDARIRRIDWSEFSHV